MLERITCLVVNVCPWLVQELLCMFDLLQGLYQEVNKMFTFHAREKRQHFQSIVDHVVFNGER